MKIALIQGFLNIPTSIYFAKYLEMGNLGVILGTNITLSLSAFSYPFRLKLILNRMKKNLENNSE